MNETKEHFAKPRKVALYMHMSGALQGWVHVAEVRYVDYDEHYQTLPGGQQREKQDAGSVRISQPLEIAFTAADNEQVVANAVAALDEAERQAIEDLNKKLADIRGRKAQFLALSHQPETV